MALGRKVANQLLRSVVRPLSVVGELFAAGTFRPMGCCEKQTRLSNSKKDTSSNWSARKFEIVATAAGAR